MRRRTASEKSVRGITESDVEEGALAWLEDLGWAVAHGPDIAPDTPGAERADYRQVVLERRLRDALAALNPVLRFDVLDVTIGKLTGPDGSTLHALNWSCRADPPGST